LGTPIVFVIGGDPGQQSPCRKPRPPGRQRDWRDSRRCRLGGQHGLGAVEPRDHLDLASHQIGRERRQAILVTICPAVLDREIGAFDKAAFLEAAMESCQPLRKRAERLADQKADQRGCWLLRAHWKRPSRRCAAEKLHYVAASHYSMTSSAIASSVGGISISKIFAVC
jgi:hypothetical protein